MGLWHLVAGVDLTCVQDKALLKYRTGIPPMLAMYCENWPTSPQRHSCLLTDTNGQGRLPLYHTQFIVSTRQFTSGIQTMDVY
jgi:hypothetical protein